MAARLSLRVIMAFPQPTLSGLTLLPVDCFAHIARQRGSVWLDSSLTRGDWGGQSLMATNPVGEIVLSANQGIFKQADRHPVQCDRRTAWRELERIRNNSRLIAIGFVSYEASLPWLGLPPVRQSPGLPEMHFYVYDRVLWYDHLTNEFSDPGLAVEFLENIDDSAGREIVGNPGEAVLNANTPESVYFDRVNQAKWHIREGDIYQANFTCRFDARTRIDPFVAYLRLRRFNPAPYGAYMNFGDYQVLSSSPERMFLWEGDQITSSPIKGTIRRGDDLEETQANLLKLLNSEKDRAELLMIVDLVRNDLGKIARAGSVSVGQLYRPEIYSSLIHLVADVSARVRPGCSIEDVCSALLPGGSVTGAPKRRAVEIISELESSPRSVYTGSIGYVGQGRADFNIAIRTMTHQEECFRIHAGGGIVADSDPEAEYDEMLLKARNLIRAIGATA